METGMWRHAHVHTCSTQNVIHTCVCCVHTYIDHDGLLRLVPQRRPGAKMRARNRVRGMEGEGEGRKPRHEEHYKGGDTHTQCSSKKRKKENSSTRGYRRAGTPAGCAATRGQDTNTHGCGRGHSPNSATWAGEGSGPREAQQQRTDASHWGRRKPAPPPLHNSPFSRGGALHARPTQHTRARAAATKKSDEASGTNQCCGGRRPAV